MSNNSKYLARLRARLRARAAAIHQAQVDESGRQIIGAGRPSGEGGGLGSLQRERQTDAPTDCRHHYDVVTPSSCARTRAYEFGKSARQTVTKGCKPTAPRAVCGARRHRDGQPCHAKAEPGKARCRFHGGRSTGPRTPEGKARSRANLRQYRCKREE